MEILVCIKPVPDPDKYGDLRIDPETKRLVREGVPTVINPADKNALEEALRLREKFGGSVTVLSMAPAFSRDWMVESLAMGADRAFLLSDPLFGGADTYVTSRVLAEAVRKIADSSEASSEVPAAAPEASAEATEAAGVPGFDLILAGNESADGGTSHVPAQLAEWLELPHICGARSLEVDSTGGEAAGDASGAEADAVLRAACKSEEGTLIFECPMPAVVAVGREANKPRLVNAMGIIKARKKPLTIWSNEDLGLDPESLGLGGSPTKAGQLFEPDLGREGASLGDDPEAAAVRILELIEKAGV